MPIILENVNYTYNLSTPFEKKAISDISFTLEYGQTALILGRSGSGKSTLLQLIGGLIKPTSGILKVTDFHEKPVNIAVVFQYPERQFFEETVHKDLSFYLAMSGRKESEIETKIHDVFACLDLKYDNFRNRSPFELSDGEKRRIAIASAILSNQAVIALDEPLAGLDPVGKKDILRILKRLQTECGMTIIIASNELSPVSDICSRFLYLRDGRLIREESGTSDKMVAC